MDAYNTGVLVGALVVGFLCGLLPLIVSFSRKCVGVGFVGMMLCIASGFVLGLLLALPVSICYTCWMCKTFYVKRSEQEMKDIAMRLMS